MNRISFIVILVFLTLAFTGSTFSQEKNKENKEVQTIKSETSKPFNTICPVSTEDVDNEITYTYKDKTYALCCNNCLKKFKKDPEKYISRLSEDGKSVVKQKETK